MRALRRPVPTFEQLTFHRGRIGGARFASEAGAVVYSEARDGKALEVCGAPTPAARSHATSATAGRTSLRSRGQARAVAGAPLHLWRALRGDAGGGAPIGEGTSPASWRRTSKTPTGTLDGAQLAIVRSVGVQGESFLEYPVRPQAAQDARAPSAIRVSPVTASRIAFVEDKTSGGGRAGRWRWSISKAMSRPLTDELGAACAASPGRRPAGEIWFAAGGARTNRALRAVDLERRQRLILEAPASLTLWDIGLDGRILLARDDERSALVGVPPGETAERDCRGSTPPALADLSEDGTTVLFDDRFGVYVRDTTGSPPVDLDLKGGHGDDFSPDGERVLATTDSGRRLVVVPASRAARERRCPPTASRATGVPSGSRTVDMSSSTAPCPTKPDVHPLRSYVQDRGRTPPPPAARPRSSRRGSPRGRRRSLAGPGPLPARTRGPRTSRGTFSRVWSVDTSDGSQPWSAVRMKTSSSRIAAQTSGQARSSSSRLPAKPGTSLRWPNSVSKSTRFVKMRPRSISPIAFSVWSTPSLSERVCTARRDPPPAEDVLDLADPEHRPSRRGQAVQQRLAARRHREVAAVRACA